MAPFPPEPRGRIEVPAALGERGFSLRALRVDDLLWLRDLYASTRAEEMAPVPWPEGTKRSFLDQQFALQHAHYIAHYGDADFLALEHDGRPAGRYYLQRTAPSHLIVDICLFPALRGSGVGAALIRASQVEAAALGFGMHLSVACDNTRAQQLYQRLGFMVAGEQGPYIAMNWTPALS